MKSKIFLLSIFLIFTKFTHATKLSNDISKAISKAISKYAGNYGNKSTNLIVLQEQLSNLIKGIPESIGKRVRVPEIFPLNHDDILKCFGVKKNDQQKTIQDLWNKFTQQGGEDTRNLSVEAKKILADIRTMIANIFKEPPNFLEDAKYNNEELKTFLSNQKQNQKYLIVRSTGKEDSIERANAGGNESKPYVESTLKDVSEAMGFVAASYFSEKSIGQRLALKDKKVFDKESFFMPILIQEMIGEQVAEEKQYIIEKNKIPVSGVAFSREPYANTEELSLIQATYGNNEAIVAGLAPFDTFFVGPKAITNNVYPTIRYKSQRLRPEKVGGTIKLGFEKNDRQNDLQENRISGKQCLPNNITQVATLKF